jgi:hypothetical protein
MRGYSAPKEATQMRMVMHYVEAKKKKKKRKRGAAKLKGPIIENTNDLCLRNLEWFN